MQQKRSNKKGLKPSNYLKLIKTVTVDGNDNEKRNQNNIDLYKTLLIYSLKRKKH